MSWIQTQAELKTLAHLDWETFLSQFQSDAPGLALCEKYVKERCVQYPALRGCSMMRGEHEAGRSMWPVFAPAPE